MKSKTVLKKKGSSTKRGSFFIKEEKNSKIPDPTFTSRKADHLVLALDSRTQTDHLTDRFIDRVQLRSTAFPEINFNEVKTETQFQSHKLSAPFFISSMTSGTALGEPINEAFALISQEKQILMGVGSQRKELHDDSALKEWRRIRKKYPKALLLSNLGLSQLISTPIERVNAIIDNLESVGLIIHCNALQECLQKEGTPKFRNGLATIESLAQKLRVPVIVKEVGFGFSQKDLVHLNQAGVAAVDFSGRGGTNWAHIEALRYPKKSIEMETGFVFSDWGYDIQEWIGFHDRDGASYQFWSSGGIRNGLDVAKMVAMGSNLVGMAQPWLQNLVVDWEKKKLDVDGLFNFYDKTLRELKIAQFCCGYADLELFRKSKAFYVR